METGPGKELPFQMEKILHVVFAGVDINRGFRLESCTVKEVSHTLLEWVILLKVPKKVEVVPFKGSKSRDFIVNVRLSTGDSAEEERRANSFNTFMRKEIPEMAAPIIDHGSAIISDSGESGSGPQVYLYEIYAIPPGTLPLSFVWDNLTAKGRDAVMNQVVQLRDFLSCFSLSSDHESVRYNYERVAHDSKITQGWRENKQEPLPQVMAPPKLASRSWKFQADRDENGHIILTQDMIAILALLSPYIPAKLNIHSAQHAVARVHDSAITRWQIHHTEQAELYKIPDGSLTVILGRVPGHNHLMKVTFTPTDLNYLGENFCLCIGDVDMHNFMVKSESPDHCELFAVTNMAKAQFCPRGFDTGIRENSRFPEPDPDNQYQPKETSSFWSPEQAVFKLTSAVQTL